MANAMNALLAERRRGATPEPCADEPAPKCLAEPAAPKVVPAPTDQDGNPMWQPRGSALAPPHGAAIKVGLSVGGGANTELHYRNSANFAPRRDARRQELIGRVRERALADWQGMPDHDRYLALREEHAAARRKVAALEAEAKEALDKRADLARKAPKGLASKLAELDGAQGRLEDALAVARGELKAVEPLYREARASRRQQLQAARVDSARAGRRQQEADLCAALATTPAGVNEWLSEVTSYSRSARTPSPRNRD
jgi:hypothetical protein